MTSTLRQALDVPWSELTERKLVPIDVAIFDSGIDCTHPALSGRIVEAYGVASVDGQESVFALPTDANNDEFGHGTAVASIIARIAPNARLFDVRVLGRDNTGGEEILTAALNHGVEKRWSVLNLSLAAGYRMKGELDAACEAAYYQGQTVVAAKRNIPIGGDGLPAEFSSCIGVDIGSYEPPFQFAFRTGTPIEVVAGGDGVTVAVRGGGWTTMSGTSFATPAVSGLCALLLGAFPDLLPFEIKSILRTRAIPRGAS